MEDPMAIADEISSYINHPVEKIADREAIKAAMAITNHELDLWLFAGKGGGWLLPKSFKARKKPIQEMQPSQKIIYKIDEAAHNENAW